MVILMGTGATLILAGIALLAALGLSKIPVGINKYDARNPDVPQTRYGNLSYREYNQLASYNAEKSRGVLHSGSYKLQMAELQHRHDEALSLERGLLD